MSEYRRLEPKRPRRPIERWVDLSRCKPVGQWFRQLTWDECEEAGLIGLRSQLHALQTLRGLTYARWPRDRWNYAVEGRAGELAVSLMLDVPWPARITRGGADVAGCEVRTTLRIGDPIWAKAVDPATRPVILVYGVLPFFKAVGWELAGEIRRRGTGGDCFGSATRDKWELDVAELRPMDALPPYLDRTDPGWRTRPVESDEGSV